MSQPGYVFTPGRGYSNLIIPLQYISAGEMAEILEPVVPEERSCELTVGEIF